MTHQKPKYRWCPDLGAIFPDDIFPRSESEELSNSSISSIEISPDKSQRSIGKNNRCKIPVSDRVLRSATKSLAKSRTNEQKTESLSSLNLNESTWSDLDL